MKEKTLSTKAYKKALLQEDHPYMEVMDDDVPPYKGTMTFSLKDFEEALTFIKNAHYTEEEMYHCWYEPLFCHMEDKPIEFDPNQAIHQQDFDFTLSTHQFFMEHFLIRNYLQYYVGHFLFGRHEPLIPYDYVLKTIKAYNKVKKTGFFDDELLEIPLGQYAQCFLDPSFLKAIPVDRLDNARHFLLQHSLLQYRDVLETLAYSYYEGTRLFPCDYYKAKGFLEQAFEVEDDPRFANSLGYIYFYGRLGKPDYQKAFSYFSYGALHDNVESRFKLAQMYLQGLGCRASFRTAKRLYESTYAMVRNSFEKEPTTLLATASYQYARFTMEQESRDAFDVLNILYEGRFVAQKLIEQSTFYGDIATYNNINALIAALEEKVGSTVFGDVFLDNTPSYLSLLKHKGYDFYVTYVEGDEDKDYLSVTIHTNNGSLLSVLPFQQAYILHTINYALPKDTMVEDLEYGESFTFARMEEERDGGISFYDEDNNIITTIYSNQFILEKDIFDKELPNFTNPLPKS